MTPEQAKITKKKVVKEIFDLNPSAIIELYEIDFTDILFDLDISSPATLLTGDNTVFRFHNNTKLLDSSLYRGGLEYIAAPIMGEGFEYTSAGTLPTPTLTLSVSENAVPLLTELRQKLFAINDLAGAKVTRIKTCLKWLDEINFIDQVAFDEIDPDPNALISKDIFFIDRKVNESSNIIQYELASILDVEGVKLPRRLVVAERCPFSYRGEGCCYEFSSRRNEDIHGNASLPLKAPAVANDKDEEIQEILGVSIVDQGEYKSGKTYRKGDAVFINKGGRNYYFVAKENNPTSGPPNLIYWIADTCGKSTNSCMLRFGTNGSVVTGESLIIKGQLRYGGFRGINRLNS